MSNKPSRVRPRVALPLFLILGLLIAIQLASVAVLSRTDSAVKRAEARVAVADGMLSIAEDYERTSYLAVLALASGDWDLLLEQRRRAEVLAADLDLAGKAVLEGGRAVAGGLDVTVEPSSDPRVRQKLTDAQSHWQVASKSQVRLIRSNNLSLKENADLEEFKTEAAKVTAALAELVQLTRAEAERDARTLRTVITATPIAQLGLTLLLGLFVFARILRPLGNALTDLAESELKLTAAKDDLEQKVRERTAELTEANETLEQRVLDRTAALERARAAAEQNLVDLKQAQSQLVRLSRQAGMAEVATGVLHNVGNALNSVNVSAEILLQSVQASQVTGLVNACELLKKNERDLAGFFAEGKDGPKLVAYLQGISDCLVEERREVLAELTSMYTGVEHVKTIITRQQTLAKAASVMEVFEPSKLIEEALSFSSASLQQEGIETESDEGSPVSILGDRNKLMQILLNLISNARHAVRAALRSGRLDAGKGKLRMTASQTEAEVTITIEDNGIGIAPENLEKIFVHGFTTKTDGHGFGLHSSALAAKELGGRIDVQSDGEGKGARFSVVLPKRAADVTLAKEQPEA